MIRSSVVAASVLLLALTGCPKKPEGGGGGTPPTVKRCEVDLGATGYFAAGGTGALAKVVDAQADLIGGEGATGQLGDVLLQNDKLRVIVEKPGRVVGPMPSGGSIVDADLVRAPGEKGNDQFGRMALFYAMGRLPSIDHVEVLADGSAGGPAVVAATGHDALHDLVNIEKVIKTQGGLDLKFVVDPFKPLPLLTTTYYVLSPGESRVRMLTAFCNEGTAPAELPLIELNDMGVFGLFIPNGCADGLAAMGLSAAPNCLIQPTPWFASQGTGIAYGRRAMSLTDLTVPGKPSSVVGYAGVVGSVLETGDINGLLSWTDVQARNRPGDFAIRGGAQRLFLRDFFVAKDIASISSQLLALDHAARGHVDVTATLPDGSPAKAARISVKSVATGHMVTLLEADALGKGGTDLEPGEYALTASLEGRLLGPEAKVTIVEGGTITSTLTLGEAHTLTLTVADPFGAPIPAKVTVLCKGGTCPFSAGTYHQHLLLDPMPGNVGAIGFVPPSGHLTVTLPPAEYAVVVTRGPEYSAWPDTWPVSGKAVDLRTADQSVAAVLGHVVDSAGWMSADLHVHAVNSSDSAVGNAVRASDFMAEGVDVLVSTDHEVLTDFAPVVHELGGDDVIATMVGEEVTSFTHGHFNAFPLTRDGSAYGGPFDHAGGEDGPTYRLTQLFDAIRAKHPGAVVQINHPRGGSGALTQLKVDTATLATHGDPADFFMAPAPDATAEDTRLLNDSFDLLETANGPNPSFTVLNDWMTFLSRGTVRAATGVSDTHANYSDTGGYARTYVRVGVDAPKDFTGKAFADGLRAHHAFVTNGPFLRVSAKKVDASGTPTGPSVDVGDTVSISGAGGEGVQLSVDVQGPEWMLLDRLELYTFAPGREATNGDGNDTWPESRIAEVHALDRAALPLEAVPGQNGLTVRRLHVTDTFTAHPTKDAWYVVMARQVNGGSLFPLHSAQAIAYSNAVLVDADGSGAYDDFPLKATRSRVPVLRAQASVPRRPTPEEFAKALVKILEHKHQ